MTHHTDFDKALTALERQMDELRKQASSLAERMSRRAPSADDLRSRAREAYDGASWGLRKADRYARRGGGHLTSYARHNPATASTAGVAAAALIGLGVWYLLRSGR